MSAGGVIKSEVGVRGIVSLKTVERIELFWEAINGVITKFVNVFFLLENDGVLEVFHNLTLSQAGLAGEFRRPGGLSRSSVRLRNPTTLVEHRRLPAVPLVDHPVGAHYHERRLLTRVMSVFVTSESRDVSPTVHRARARETSP